MPLFSSHFLKKLVRSHVFNFSEITPHDYVIEGSGFSGLTAALRLLNLEPSASVLLLERNAAVGGRCITRQEDALHFELGCNVLGSSVVPLLQELGVSQEFKPVRHRLIFDGSVVPLPLNLKSAWQLAHPLDAYRLYQKIKQAQGATSMDEILSVVRHTAYRNQLAALLTYFSCRPLSAIRLDFAQKTLFNDYGYDQPMVPVGGMDALIHNMLNRVQDLGGTIRCHTAVEGVHVLGETQCVRLRDTRTGQEDAVYASCVISSVAGWQDPALSGCPPSLAVSAFLLTMDARFVYPEGLHTMVFVPSDVDAFFHTHEAGQWSHPVAFHCFKKEPHPKDPKNRRAISAYILSPRGMAHCAPETQALLQAHVLNTIDAHLPGFKNAVVQVSFYDPARYQSELGMASLPAPRMVPHDYVPPLHNAQKSVYYIGVTPAAEQHALGVMRSALRIANHLALEHGIPYPEQTSKAHKRHTALLKFFAFFLTTGACVVAFQKLWRQSTTEGIKKSRSSTWFVAKPAHNRGHVHQKIPCSP